MLTVSSGCPETGHRRQAGDSDHPDRKGQPARPGPASGTHERPGLAWRVGWAGL